MTLHQTFLNHARAITFSFIAAIIIFGIGIYFKADRLLWILFAGFYAITTIPALYLHLRYYLKNKGKKIRLNNNELNIMKDGYETKYLKEDLEYAVVHKSASLDNGIPFSAMEYYYYVEIIAKNRQKIIITSLMGSKIDNVLKKYLDIPFKRERSWFNIF